jgi:hypothetical protein
MKKTASTEAAVCRIDGAQDAKKEIPVDTAGSWTNNCGREFRSMRSRFTLLALTAQLCVAALNAQDTAPAKKQSEVQSVGSGGLRCVANHRRMGGTSKP